MKMICIKEIKNQSDKTIGTVGNFYYIRTTSCGIFNDVKSFYSWFRGDDGISYFFTPSYFKSIDEIRNEKLQELGI